MHAPAPRARTISGRLLAAFPTLFAVVLLAVAARWFSARWAAVLAGGPAPTIDWPWLGLAFVLLVVHAGAAMFIWRQVLRAVGARLSVRDAVDSFVPSILARYIPGKIWANTVRLALGRRAGVRYGASTGAILWETLLGLWSAGVVAFAGLASGADPAARRAAVILVVGTSAAWIAATLLARHPRGAAFLHRLGNTEPVRSPAALAPSVVTSFIAWTFYGTAHLAIARALGPVGLDAWPLVAGSVALAWAGGYLAIVMPVGLGVRDGILLVLLASLLDPARALLFVALSRLVQLAVDSSLTVGWIIHQSMRHDPSPAAVPPSA